jgi:hypothetical protein
VTKMIHGSLKVKRITSESCESIELLESFLDTGENIFWINARAFQGTQYTGSKAPGVTDPPFDIRHLPNVENRVRRKVKCFL